MQAAVQEAVAAGNDPNDSLRGLYISDEQAVSLAAEPGTPTPGARLDEAVSRLGLDALDSSVLALCVGRRAFFERSRDRFFRRLDGLLRRYPDVRVEVATTRLSVTRYLQECIGAVQLVVIGSGDAGRVTQLVGPHGLPILRHADCSVLVVRGTDH